jgi:hypothetical protein
MHAVIDRCCPYCSGVVVGGDDSEGMHYYWCVTCQRAVDPVSDEDEEDDEDDIPELGSCCICEREDGVRNILMLNKRGPIPGHGWGCFVCGLPADGASAVLCDSCFEAVQGGTAQIKWACRGYPAEDGRILIDALTEPFDHDAHFHSANEDAHEDIYGRGTVDRG